VKKYTGIDPHRKFICVCVMHEQSDRPPDTPFSMEEKFIRSALALSLPSDEALNEEMNLIEQLRAHLEAKGIGRATMIAARELARIAWRLRRRAASRLRRSAPTGRSRAITPGCILR